MMSSVSGFVNYLEYVAGTSKGATARDDLFNSPFGLKDVDADYTSARVVEVLTADLTLSWTPVARIVKVDNVELTKEERDSIVIGKDGKIEAAEGATLPASIKEGAKVAYIYDNSVIPQNDLPILNARMQTKPLVARARRIAIYYLKVVA